MLKAVAKAARTLKEASIMVEVLTDLLLAKTKSTMIDCVVAFTWFVVIVIVSFAFC